MNLRLLPALLIGLAATLPAPRTMANIDVDFRLELGWRADYDLDFDTAVVLYEYSNFRGRRLVLYPGEQLDDFYDYEWGFRVRSVEVFGPVHVVLFDESGLWGHQLTVHSSIDDLGDYRMRLNDYSTFRWHRRARSAYVSFNEPGFRVSVSIGAGIYPRIYCARPIIPIYYDPWPNYHYHCPRPSWNYNRWNQRREPVPPPRARPYRPGSRPPVAAPPPRFGSPPVGGPPPGRPPSGVTGRPPSRPPEGHPPGHPGNVPGGDVTPSGRPGGAPPSRPPQAEAPGNRPGGNPGGRPPSTRPPQQGTPGNPPANTPPARQPTRTEPPSQPATQPPQTSSPPRVSPPSRPTRVDIPRAAPRNPPSSAPRSAPSSRPPARPSGGSGGGGSRGTPPPPPRH